MVALPKPTHPWDELSMDFIVRPLPMTHDLVKVDLSLILVNRYMHMAKFFAISKTINVAELACFLYNEIELKFKRLSDIVLD